MESEDQDRQMGTSSVAEIMEAEENKGKRTLVQGAAAILIAIGLAFTGYLNFMLYSRAFPDTLKILGLIPAVLIEGSLSVFLLGSFVWFAHGTQGTLAKIFGWFMFAIVALNSVIEFNVLVGGDGGENEFLRLYSFWGVPIVIPLVVGFWKAVIDSDPSIQIMRQRRKIQQTLQVAKMHSVLAELGSEESRAALRTYGVRGAGEINNRLRGELPASQQLLEAKAKPTPVVLVNKPSAPQEARYSADEILAAVPEQFRDVAKGFIGNLGGGTAETGASPSQPSRRARRRGLRLAKDSPANGKVNGGPKA